MELETKVKVTALLTKHGVKTKEIANDLEVSSRTVLRYRKRARDNTPSRKPRPKCTISPKNVAIAKVLFKSKPNMSKRKVARAFAARGIKMSPSSALTCAKEAGIKKFALKRKPPLSKDHKNKRLKYASTHANRKWRNALFVDETGVELAGRPNSKTQGQWAESAKEVPYKPRHKHPLRVNAFAAVCWNGRSKLVFYEGTMTGKRYADILEDVLPDMKPIVFKSRKCFVVQDATPLHFTKEVMRVFEANGIDVVPKPKWPPNSPDLNPIEHVWSMLKDRVSERSPTTKAELMQYAAEEWEIIPQQMIQNCISALPARLRLVTKNKGGYTGK